MAAAIVKNIDTFETRRKELIKTLINYDNKLPEKTVGNSIEIVSDNDCYRIYIDENTKETVVRIRNIKSIEEFNKEVEESYNKMKLISSAVFGK